LGLYRSFKYGEIPPCFLRELKEALRILFAEASPTIFNDAHFGVQAYLDYLIKNAPCRGI